MTQQPVPPPPAKPRARWLVLSGVWLIYAAFGLVASSVAPLVDEIARELRMSHSAMGGVMGAWQLVFIVAAIPCGRLLDRPAIAMPWCSVCCALQLLLSDADLPMRRGNWFAP